MTQTASFPAPAPWQQTYPIAPAPRHRVGAFGLTSALLGVTAVVVSFTGLPWFRDGTVRVAQDDSGSFGIVHDALVRISLASGFRIEGQPIALAYFSWLGWALLLAAGALAVLATPPTAAGTALRSIGAVVSIGAVGLTAAAIDLISVQPGTPGRVDPPYTEYLSKTGAGFWTAIAGFTLLAVASLAGSRRRY